MQAVGNALLQAKPNARVMYMTAESFVQDFVSSLQKARLKSLRKTVVLWTCYWSTIFTCWQGKKPA
jgi:chromosomal replication initiation ATPase DnaA